MSGEDNRLDSIRPVLSALGREWADRRRQVEGQCAYCGQTFTGIATKRFCSNLCRIRAHRAAARARVAPAEEQP